MQLGLSPLLMYTILVPAKEKPCQTKAVWKSKLLVCHAHALYSIPVPISFCYCSIKCLFWTYQRYGNSL